MAEAGSNNEMFTSRKSLESEDIEAGSSGGHFSDTEREVSPRESLMEEMSNGANNVEYADDIEKWAGSLSKKLEDVPLFMCNPGHPGRISRIPENLRQINVKAYEPYILALGPYHHGKSGVQRMEKRKWLLLKCVLENRPELTLKDYLNEMKSIEPAARSFYSDIDMESEEFVRMLLLDSLYLVTAFCGITRGQDMLDQIDSQIGSEVDEVSEVGDDAATERVNPTNEDIRCMDGNENTQMAKKSDEPNDGMRSGESNKTRLFSSLYEHDLFLLENQLPFFVLEKIHAFAYGGSGNLLLDIMKDRVRHVLVPYTKLETEMTTSEKVHHLLHLCQMFFRPRISQKSTSFEILESNQIFRLGSAMQLYKAGVSFEAISGSAEHCLLDITFSRGKLSMPCLHVDDNTDSLLRNLIALEQMKYPSMGLHVSAYAVLLLHLVTTPKDVELLRRKGIIEHHLASDKEMMYLVNRLSVGLSFDYVEDRYSLKPLFHELKRYSERRVPRWKAWLKHRHFSNPWTVISLMVGFMFLLLSSVQTYYAVYSFYYPCVDCH